MGMSRCYSLMKCLLIIFNILLLCVGCGACGFAAWALWDGGAGESASGRAGLCALAAWGCAVCVASLAALCGAVRASAALLAAAAALLTLTALAEAGAAWWGAAHLPQLRAALLQRLERTVRHDYGVMPARTQLIDAIQQGLECCGAGDTRDWQSSVWSRSVAAGAGAGAGALAAPPPLATEALDLSVSAPPAYYWVPASCCIRPESAECASSRRLAAGAGAVGAGAVGAEGSGLHGAGCGGRVVSALQQAARGPLAAAAALLLVHAAALVLALTLAVRAPPHHRYKA